MEKTYSSPNSNVSSSLPRQLITLFNAQLHITQRSYSTIDHNWFIPFPTAVTINASEVITSGHQYLPSTVLFTPPLSLHKSHYDSVLPESYRPISFSVQQDKYIQDDQPIRNDWPSSFDTEEDPWQYFS